MRPALGTVVVVILVTGSACSASPSPSSSPRSAAPLAGSSEPHRHVSSSKLPALDQPAGTTQPVLVWTPGSLPAGLPSAVRHLSVVERIAVFTAGTAWMTRSFDATGRTVDRPTGGMAIPLDVAGVSPNELAHFVPGSDRALAARTARGGGLIGTTESRLRQIGVGGVLEFGAADDVKVVGVVADAAIGGHEVMVSQQEADLLGISAPRYLLVEPKPGTAWRTVGRAIHALVPAGTPVRIRGPGEAMYLREADAVLPPVIMKSVFGEFAASPQVPADGALNLDPSWERSHIVSATVPILGTVRCNRTLIPLLRGALGEVQARGLTSLVHPDEYGGCFNARLIRGSAEDISTHTWGAAVDLNVAENPFGGTPHQDPRLVAIFARWGFAWGGRFLIPDGMHFQFQCVPYGMNDPSGPRCRGRAV